MSVSVYSSTGELPRVMRSGGRGFYRDRGLPYREPRTEERDRRRSPEAREAAAVGRTLDELAKKHPRFKDLLHKTRFRVLVQTRTPQWKCRQVLKHLSGCPMSPEEIGDETDMDLASVDEALSMLRQKGRAEQCTRNGGQVIMRSHGRPVEKIYWRTVN